MTVGRHLICSIRNDEVTGEKSVLLQRRNKNEALLLHRKVVTVLSCVELEAVKRYFVKNLEAYACLGVLKLYVDEEYCFMYLFFVTGCTSIGKIASTEIYRINNCSYLSLQASSDCDSRINDLQRLLMSGCFYFSISKDASTSFELSLTAQNQYFGKVPDTRFFWNYSMHNHLKQFNINPENWLVRMMCGGVEIRTLYVGAKQARACLISRLSGERAGTRFNVRGTNDDGHVANFVETEQLIVFDDGTQSSFIQTRGSVPLFWEQTGVQVGAHKLKMSRGYEASSPAFERHISILKHIYGYQLLINLLGHKGGEAILSNAYKDHLKDSSHSFDTHMVAFDYHLHCGGGKTENIKILIEKAQPSIDNFQYFTLLGDKLLRSQVGTIRTNCIDCLDRTNAVQTEIGLNLLKKQLESVGITDLQSHSKFHEALKALWQLNGDHISRMYTGTGAMEAGTKGTIGSKLHDGAISVKRTLKNNFFDGSKQEAIDILLLGNSFIGSVGERARALLGKAYLHAPPKILRDICFQHKQFTKIHSMRVTVGTWNVNGGKHFRSIAYKHQSMHDWLLDYYKLAVEGVLDHSETFDKATDIFAIGFEELVDLNTGNIISTSSNQKKEWGIKLQEVISRNHPYGLVSAEQLVGVCLFVFVRLQHIPYLRDVAVSVVKTGLKGKAGNKGAVAVRMLFHATSLCFVCGHFAAGQSNVLERNNNYHDISRRLCFPMGMSLGLHDYIFWCGDFNYRINLPYNEVKELLKEKQWPALLANDQLLMQKAEHKVFGDFIEGTINFPPTYKYDLFSNDYDTSEKMRTPAWTDRILWRRKKYINSNTISDDTDDDDIPPDWKVYKQSPVEMFNPGTIVYYGRAELKTSDHRPVIAVIDIEVEQTIKSKLQQIQREVLKVSELNEPTVFIDVEFEEKKVEIDLEELLQLLSVYGNLIMLRLLDNRFYATFDNGISAMNAVELNGRKLHNVTLSVTMASNNFLPQLEESFCTLMDDSFLIHKEDGEDLEKFNSSHRKMSEILLSSIGRQGSILEPEILNQQANYIEDYLDEIPDDILEEDIDLREENENLIKENLRVSSDEEDDMKLQHDSLNLLPTPKPRLQSKYIVDQAVQSTLPKRPDLPPQKVTLKPEKPQPPKLKQIPKVNPPRPDPVAPISISGNFPERPVRPDRKPSPSVKSPAPPRPPAVPKKDINKDGSNKEVELTHLSVEGKVDGGVSTPFNIQHLMHVNHSNVDEFISMMTLDVNKTNKPSTKRLSMHGSKSLNQFPKIPNRTSTEPIVTPNLMVTEQSLQKPVSPVLPHISKSNSTDSFLKAEAQNVSAGELSLVKSEESLQVSVPSSQAFLKKPPPRPKMRPVTLNLEDMAIDFQVPYNDINNSLSNLSPTDDLHQVPSKEIVASSFINNLVSNEKPPLPKRSPPGSCTSKSQSIPSFDVLENSEFSLLEKHPDRSIHLQSTDIKYKLPVESSEIKDCILPPVPPRLGNQQEDMSQRSNFSLGFITERSTLSEETTQIEQKKLNAPPPLPKRKDVKAPPPVPPR